MKIIKENYAKIAQIVSIGVVIIILFYVVFSYFGPLGYTNLAIVFNGNKLPTYVSEITGLESTEKNLKSNKTYRRVLGSVVSLKLKLFKSYKNLGIKIKYNNQNTNFALASIALKTPFKNGSVRIMETKILENKLFDEIDWYKISDRNLDKILFQKGDDICLKKVDELKKEKNIDEETEYQNCASLYDNNLEYLKEQNLERKWVNYDFENVNDFMNNLSNIAEKQKICYFNLPNLAEDMIISDYIPSFEDTSFDYAFSGFSTIETYIQDEDLDFRFNYQDLNNDSKKNDFKIFVYDGNKKIFEKNIEDDGNIKGDEKISEIKYLDLLIPNLKTGRYKIYLDANDDIIFNSFSTKQKYWTFLDEIEFADNGRSIDLFSDSSSTIFVANKESALQEVIVSKEEDLSSGDNDDFNQKKFEILKTEKSYTFMRNIISRIYISNTDLNVKFNNRMATSLESLQKMRSDNLVNFADFLKFKESSCDYIISDYFTRPVSKNDVLTSSADFEIENIWTDDKNYLLLTLNFPKYNRNLNNDIKISRIDLKYSR